MKPVDVVNEVFDSPGNPGPQRYSSLEEYGSHASDFAMLPAVRDSVREFRLLRSLVHRCESKQWL